MQVFVLNYMVIFFLRAETENDLFACHVFSSSPAFTFVIYLIIVSFENVCEKVLFPVIYTLN